MLYTQLEKTPPEQRQFAVMLGFLASCATHDPDFYNTTLDSLINDELLGLWFPIFQLTSTIDAYGIERLHKSIDSGKVRIESFRHLAWGRRHEFIDDDNLATLVQKISAKEGGLFVAIEILSMRFHRSKDEPIDCSPKLVGAGREVMSNFPYDTERTRNGHPDYELAQIANVCLKRRR